MRFIVSSMFAKITHSYCCQSQKKETPAKGRGFKNFAGVCPCFHSVSFSPLAADCIKKRKCSLDFDSPLMNYDFKFIREDHLIILNNDIIRFLVVVINYLRVSGINS